jgi:hypothetical protein
LTQNEKLPAIAGVPLIVPPNESERPGGSKPPINV